MAKTLDRSTLSIDLRSVVSGAVTAVRAVRRSETARKQSEFQKAVADGLSYEDQVTFLQKLQAEEKELGTIGDSDFVKSLDKDISDTKKLVRFSKFRSKYQSSLSLLAAGKTTADQQLAMLEDQLSMTTDPDLKLEIMGDITDTQVALKKYNDTIVTNQISRAQKDGSQALINDVMSTVRSKRASAAIDGNEEEVSYYDLQLTALTSQLSQTQIVDSLNDATVRTLTRGLKATEKLDMLNQKIEGSDGSAPVTISNVRYNSAKEYWQTVQGSYLAGAGSGVFSDFFGELSTQTKDYLNTASARDGYATEPTLASINSTYTQLATRPEMTLYQDRLTNTKTASMFDAVAKTAGKILDSATSGNFSAADNALVSLGKTYGIDVTAYRTDLAATIAQQKNANLATPSDVSTAEKIITEAGVVPTITDPTKPNETPKPNESPATPATPAAPTEGKNYKVVAGDTLSKIALANKTTVAQLIELNPQYKDNPNLIQVNDVVKLTPAPVTPATPPTPTPVSTPTPPTPTPQTPPTPPASQGAKEFKKKADGMIEVYEGGKLTGSGSLDFAKGQGYTGN